MRKRKYFKNQAHPFQVTIFLSVVVTMNSCVSNKQDSNKGSDKKSNIILIFTDQQNSNMMSGKGNPYLRTPAMDMLASEGLMFTHVYCTGPVCGPSRSSLISGRMPHETGVEWNGQTPREDIHNAGEIFRDAGYETVWAGKWHLPESYPQQANSKQKTIRGFDLLPIDGEPVSRRDYLVAELADFTKDPSRKGRMVRTKHFKYNIYSTGEEQIFHISADPGETQNLATEPALEEVRMLSRKYLKQWGEITADSFAIDVLKF